MKANWIGHICHPETWAAARSAGEYRPASLDLEGFIHCSTPAQIPCVVSEFYPDPAGLLLLWIDPDQLESELRWEAIEGGERFPHIYGPLQPRAVAAVEDLPAFLRHRP